MKMLTAKKVLQLFLTNRMHTNHATTIVNGFIGAYLLFGVAGGLFADWIGKRGNYIVGAFGAVVWVVGAAILVLPKSPPTEASWARTLIGLSAQALGYGVINPTQVVFVGSQYASGSVEESTAIAYLYFAYNVGNLMGESSAPQLRESEGAYFALLVIFIASCGGALVYLLGSPLYRNALLRHPSERAALSAPDKDDPSQSLLVKDDARKSLDLSPMPLVTIALIIAPLPVFYAILYQQNTTMVTQGTLLDRRLFGTSYKVPPDLMSSLEDWFLLIVIPLLDRLIYPCVSILRGSGDIVLEEGESAFARVTEEQRAQKYESLSRSRHLLARMALGLIASSLAMISCALVSALAEERKTSILIQVPALFMLSISEAMVSISGLQLVVSEARLRGTNRAAVATSLWLALGAIGAFLGMGSANIPWEPMYAFGAFAILGFIGSAIIAYSYFRCPVVS